MCPCIYVLVFNVYWICIVLSHFCLVRVTQCEWCCLSFVSSSNPSNRINSELRFSFIYAGNQQLNLQSTHTNDQSHLWTGRRGFFSEEKINIIPNPSAVFEPEAPVWPWMHHRWTKSMWIIKQAVRTNNIKTTGSDYQKTQHTTTRGKLWLQRASEGTTEEGTAHELQREKTVWVFRNKNHSNPTWWLRIRWWEGENTLIWISFSYCGTQNISH